MLTKAFKEAHPDTPWKIVQGMRHVLVHDYANVVSATLYDTAVNDIPLLRKQVEKYLAETDWAVWESIKDDTHENTSNDANHDYNVRVAQRMKSKGYSDKEIADITGLGIQDL